MAKAAVKNTGVVEAFEELCAQTLKTGQSYIEQSIAATQIIARTAAVEQANAIAAFNGFVSAYRAQAEAFVPLATNLFATPVTEVQFRDLFGKAVDQAVEASKEVATYAAALVERETELGKALSIPAAVAAEATVELVKSAALQGGAVTEWAVATAAANRPV
jgi:hypothetical protein